MEKFIHSVPLDKDLCKGCINCIKRCPTEAIRVRDGKAHILAERCIDCGECIRICPHHAKKPLYDPLTILDDFKYTIALPPPSLYGQYNNLEEQDVVLAALLDMGFDDVYEVAKAAELVSDATRRILQTGSIERPVISSACPAVTRLIRVRFPQSSTMCCRWSRPSSWPRAWPKKRPCAEPACRRRTLAAFSSRRARPR